MKMITVYLSDGDEKRLARIRELRFPQKEVTDEQLIKNAISTYWLASEERTDKEKKTVADRRLREENMGITDNWREYDA